MPASPSVLNYFEGAGYLKFTPTSESERDFGNVVECEMTPSADKQEHKTKRNGSAKTDFTRYTNQAVQIRLLLDEVTPENLAILMMSSVETATDGTKSFRIFTRNTVTGAMTFTGTNTQGQVIAGDFPSVSFGPSGSFSLIQSDDGFHTIELTGDLLAVEATDGTSDFGTMSFADAA